MQQFGQFGVLKDCALKSNDGIDVTVHLFPHPGGSGGLPSTVGLPACDEFVVRITVGDALVPGASFFTIGSSPTGTVREDFILAKFVNTWTGLGPTGTTEYRFWKYMLEGDAVAFSSTPNIPPSSIPACYSGASSPPSGQFGRVVFRGYLNLMRPIDPNEAFLDPSGGQQFSLVMSHYDGCLDHIDLPLLNPRFIAGNPSSKHMGESYHLVTPSNFLWATAPPTASDLDLNNRPNDSIRSTVSHTTNMTTFGQSPGPLCLAEMPMNIDGATVGPLCNCKAGGGGSGGLLDFNQNFTSPLNFGSCAGMHSWVSTVLIPEIPTGFSQTYLGIWGPTSRSDVNLVGLTMATGTVEYTDHCAHNLGYTTPSNHVVWGNGTFWPSSNAPNIPTISKGIEGFLTDHMLHFGNHVRGTDDLTIVGAPAYVNVIWNTYR